MEDSGASTTPEDPDPGSESRPKYEDFAHHTPVYSDWPSGSTAPPETTTSHNVQDWPRPTTAPAADLQVTTPTETSSPHGVAAAVKKEKGRVRFNSTADWTRATKLPGAAASLCPAQPFLRLNSDD
ncbi:hypothetical protein NLG97_g6850 [Lecanicillium saksenae]|uniref:Uncharacterized protein n=1 Tax=Lecanicillium saksenae TaxID=468837 RepID=A0ACC1QNH2_9HYPO|nr:hypothetical protein NLG97_g6850 [Lecanicillium saksenae]